MTKKKILIVDDDQGILLMLQLMLRLEGYEVLVCQEATNVLATMEGENPDLVLLDAMMPHLDGLAVLNLVESSNLPTKPPIILFTGKVDESYIKQAMRAGASDILIKPFVKEELLERLQTFLDPRT
ncbi:MAG: response regulator [Acidobacteria bacterium]|nr:MAG: response regulator [Acidobacteriota bacterium]